MKAMPIQQPATFQFLIFCPACGCGHGLRVGQADGPNWTFNGDNEKPTFSPSLKVEGHLGGDKYGTCHSFIRDGMIQYCSDSTHELAGKTVPLTDL